MEIEAAERLDTINTLILTPTGEEFKQGKMDLNYWKNYDNLSRAEYFNQSKIKALVAPVKKVKNGSKKNNPQRQHSYTPILLTGKHGRVILTAARKLYRRV